MASALVIEAAYRTLVKQHHPDATLTVDEDRIKRLNTAREWLVDPVRRRRYDRATSPKPPSRRARAGTAAAEVPASSEPGFGPNAKDVRAFLAELRTLDAKRAFELRDGGARTDAAAYVRARDAAAAAAAAFRQPAWVFAREAASVIARGKLGETAFTGQVVDLVADVAGAIALRDLLPPGDFDALLHPWQWRGTDAPTAKTRRATKPARPTSAARPATPSDARHALAPVRA